jgi:L-seryl-tRNA(Ser) seleniumtransferase
LKELFKLLPSVDSLLSHAELKTLIEEHGHDRCKEIVRKYIDIARQKIIDEKLEPNLAEMINSIKDEINSKAEKSLKKVYNCTGVILHTNLGRAPLGQYLMEEVVNTVSGYCNLEYNLDEGKRGHRDTHINSVITELCDTEKAIVVNNNASGLFLILQTLAAGKEVIVSRGELVEIGGSFRIPDIMRSSGAKLVEVGTTNRTRVSDYENAITENTALILKVHQSNYFIGGFTEEASLEELSTLSKQSNIPFVYDIGSGLIRKPKHLKLHNEPDVKSSVEAGVDILCFSGDKLLCGPQAGIVTGKQQYIQKLSKSPMMRVLRVGKMTYAALQAALELYNNEEKLIQNNTAFSFLSRTEDDILKIAKVFSQKLEDLSIKNNITKSSGRCGGGTLPEVIINSYSVMLDCFIDVQTEPSQQFKFHKILRTNEVAVVSNLREGKIFFDMLTIKLEDIDLITDAINHSLKKLNNENNNLKI